MSLRTTLRRSLDATGRRSRATSCPAIPALCGSMATAAARAHDVLTPLVRRQRASARLRLGPTSSRSCGSRTKPLTEGSSCEAGRKTVSDKPPEHLITTCNAGVIYRRYFVVLSFVGLADIE